MMSFAWKKTYSIFSAVNFCYMVKIKVTFDSNCFHGVLSFYNSYFSAFENAKYGKWDDFEILERIISVGNRRGLILWKNSPVISKMSKVRFLVIFFFKKNCPIFSPLIFFPTKICLKR